MRTIYGAFIGIPDFRLDAEMVRGVFPNAWQIATGVTEAMCKTTTAHLKRCVIRWHADNADALMALAGLEQSDQWKLH